MLLGERRIGEWRYTLTIPNRLLHKGSERPKGVLLAIIELI